MDSPRQGQINETSHGGSVRGGGRHIMDFRLIFASWQPGNTC